MKLVEETTRLQDGHYVVPLPWRDLPQIKVNNRSMAERRLASLKQRFIRDPEYFRRYAAVVEQSFLKGYAVQVPESQLDLNYLPRWYLPHHGVINPKKPNKIRVVLDCAVRYGGISLNDRLLQGPDINADLVSVLLGFRSDPVAVAADIEEMFMQVRVPEKDRGALRFLWWPNSDLSVDPAEYQMVAHPFGATSSPFCASFGLRKTVEDFGQDYQVRINEAVLKNFYVDDCLTSFDNVEEARHFVPDICKLLLNSGFRLRNWVSNRPDILDAVPISERSCSSKEIGSDINPIERMLGLEWNTISDVFGLHFCVPEGSLTRRGILSSISSVYDPLGFVAPLILPAKLLLQNLCKKKLSWDEPVHIDDARTWKSWSAYVKTLGSVYIPRCLVRSAIDYSRNAQLHIFCDASETGYGAVAYARFISEHNQPYCALVFAKSRVAPIKVITVPRLELNAAVLAVRVEKIISKGWIRKPVNVTYWTDSALVLHYINNTTTRFSTFVANRVAEIHEGSCIDQWKHVRSSENPADLASRGIYKREELMIWLNGPEFLNGDYGFQPTMIPNLGSSEEVELKRPNMSINATTIVPRVWSLFTRYSEWFKLLKAVAWLTRFKYCLMRKQGRLLETPVKVGSLSVSEVKNATRDVMWVIQKEAYPHYLEGVKDEFGNHMPSASLNRNGQLRRLCPIFINGLLCVGGRLNYTTYDEEKKHPIILPNKHPVVDLLIRHFHILEGHSGPTHVLSVIRQHYWIVRGRSRINKIVRSCMLCRKQLTLPCRQQMAPLPLARVEVGGAPFEQVGIDYFGPFLVKRGRGTEKRFGCLFTCLKTRAVHLEVAFDLSTDCFIMALMRFVGRRGCPKDVYSDNGTNFVGATRELREIIRSWDKYKIDQKMLSQGIQWHFNPPACSHRGGIWERIIRSVRRILYALCREQRVTDDALQTLFVEIERILNNRPLVSNPSDTEDDTALTPNSLLLIRAAGVVQTNQSLQVIYTKRWRQVNHLANVFWQRWSKEYLPTLQTRQKWLVPKIEFKRDELVLIASENTPRGCWPLGRIVKCDPSEDGLVRTVSVRTAQGVVQRDVRRVCRLEGDG